MGMVKTPTSAAYDVPPGVKTVQDWVATLKAKTGRTLDEWIALVRAKGPREEVRRREWLQGEHALGSNAAWWIAERCRESPTPISESDPESYLKAAAQYVERQYSGKKAALRP